MGLWFLQLELNFWLGNCHLKTWLAKLEKLKVLRWGAIIVLWPHGKKGHSTIKPMDDEGVFSKDHKNQLFFIGWDHWKFPPTRETHTQWICDLVFWLLMEVRLALLSVSTCVLRAECEIKNKCASNAIAAQKIPRKSIQRSLLLKKWKTNQTNSATESQIRLQPIIKNPPALIAQWWWKTHALQVSHKSHAHQ